MDESQLTDTQKAILSVFRKNPWRACSMEEVAECLPRRERGNVYFGLGVLCGLKLLALVPDQDLGYKFKLAPVEAKCP
jgi:hypothetical protein